jgi:tetratricopeptide (TPR) repeat protein
MVTGLIALAAPLATNASAQSSSSWLGGWLSLKPSAQDLQFMYQGKDPALLQKLNNDLAAVQRKPNDEATLSEIGYICMEFSRVKTAANMWSAWQDCSAKALERAIQLNPRNYVAWHNYGQLNFEAGDLWIVNDHSNARRAFSQAIALNTKSARSYMGRGWAYLELNDGAHTRADSH